MNSDWISTDQAAKHLGVTTRYLEGLRTKGYGPRFVKMAGGRLIRYKVAWIDEWMESQAHNATCEYMVGAIS